VIAHGGVHQHAQLTAEFGADAVSAFEITGRHGLKAGNRQSSIVNRQSSIGNSENEAAIGTVPGTAFNDLRFPIYDSRAL
jgi:hypothetical protein